MASEQYGGQQQTNEELKDKIQKLHVSVSDLFDISKPWVLVPNGSLLGFFDWVSVCVKSPAVGTASTNHLDLTSRLTFLSWFKKLLSFVGSHTLCRCQSISGLVPGHL
jgi:hypothetical protein